MLNFAKSKLEEDEGISSAALARLLAAADTSTCNPRLPVRIKKIEARNLKRALTLLAASLAIAACGWFFYDDAVNTRREANLANVIDLLRMADGERPNVADSLPENLLAWQDAPTLICDSE